ncbi:hypothetical protein AGMMS49959_02860 [Planctomycetales bacterium]|nr:hypothetical protein AGMMS49959_02860 [Planctomycetales bacterium]
MPALNQGLSLHAGLRQNMAMTPQLIQAMELLELPLLDLEQRLQYEVSVNPALELAEDALDHEQDADAPETSADATAEATDADDEIDADWSNVYDDLPTSHAAARQDDDEFDPSTAIAERPVPLDEHLFRQLGLLPLTPRQLSLCREVVAGLDERGFFTRAAESIGENLLPPPTPAEQRAARQTVQSLAPTGIAAADLRECFLLQLRQLNAEEPATALAEKMVLDYLDDLAGNRLPKIAAALSCSIDDIKDAVAVLRGLTPYPGQNFLVRREPPAKPEVFIDLVKAAPDEYEKAQAALGRTRERWRQAASAAERGQITDWDAREAKAAAVDAQTTGQLFDGDGMKWEVKLANGLQPEISPVFLALFDNTARGKTLRENWERQPEKREMLSQLRRQVTGEQRKKFRENYFNAGNLLRAVRQREITLYRLTREIVARQKDYLAGRAPTPTPLMMKDLAERLDMDNGTVSRAASDKYAATPLGLRPLREFFARAVAEITPSANTEAGGTSGEQISNMLIRKRIQAIIDGEDKSMPLKDNLIQEMLEQEGIRIKRRTVAKHRGLLGIGDYAQRRQY